MSCSIPRKLSRGVTLLVVSLTAVPLMVLLPLSDALGWLTLALGLGVIWVLGVKHPRVKYVLLVAFSLRAFFALVHHYVVYLPDSQADAATFERVAAQWARMGFWGVVAHFNTGSSLYSWVIGLLYSVTVRSPLMAQGINVLFGTLIVWNVYRISALFWGHRLARRAGYAAAFFPTLVLYSAITMREVAVVYPFTLGVYYFARWLDSDHAWEFVKAVLAFAISIAFHTVAVTAMLVLVIAAFKRWFAAFWTTTFTKGMVKRGLVLGMLIVTIGLIFTTGWGLGKISNMGHVGVLRWLANEEKMAARGRAAYLVHLQIRTLFDLVWQTPVRLVYFLYAPFPWMVRSLGDLLGAMMSSFVFVLTVLMVRSFGCVWKNKKARWSFYVLASITLAFALTVSNYGTSIRHVSKVVPIVLTLVRFPAFKWRRGAKYAI